MEILGVLGCGFGPDYGQVIPLIVGALVLAVTVVVCLVVVAMRRVRARRGAAVRSWASSFVPAKERGTVVRRK